MFQYTVTVASGRDTYIWGGSGIEKDAGVPLGVPLFLTLRNDELGESITLKYRQLTGTLGKYGELKPGECFTISLTQLLGVIATPTQGDTHVECYISDPAKPQ